MKARSALQLAGSKDMVKYLKIRKHENRSVLWLVGRRVWIAAKATESQISLPGTHSEQRTASNAQRTHSEQRTAYPPPNHSHSEQRTASNAQRATHSELALILSTNSREVYSRYVRAIWDHRNPRYRYQKHPILAHLMAGFDAPVLAVGWIFLHSHGAKSTRRPTSPKYGPKCPFCCAAIINRAGPLQTFKSLWERESDKFIRDASHSRQCCAGGRHTTTVEHREEHV
jgi:hypothetical protein